MRMKIFPIKKYLVSVIAGLLLLVICPSTQAAENPMEKFNRGVVNIVTAPIEIAKQVDKGWKESVDKSENVGKGIFAGFLKGILYSVGRLGSGVWDIITFPVKVPKDYESLVKPDFVLEK